MAAYPALSRIVNRLAGTLLYVPRGNDLFVRVSSLPPPPAFATPGNVVVSLSLSASLFVSLVNKFFAFVAR